MKIKSSPHGEQRHPHRVPILISPNLLTRTSKTDEDDLRTAGFDIANQLVALSRSRGTRAVVEGAHDFVSSPVFSPRGDRLAYLVWDHPRMPWQGTELKVCGVTDREIGTARVVAGGERESIFQPAFAPDGTLFFVSDRSGWWNLYAFRGDRAEALAPRRAA